MVLQALLRGLPQVFHPAARRVMAKSLALTALLFIALGFGLWFALRAFFVWIGWAGADGGSLAQAAAAAILSLIAAWLLFRTVAIGALGLFSDEVVIAIERESYPGAARTARPVSLGGGVRFALRSVGRSVGWNLVMLPFYIALLVTGVGTILLFLAVNAYLLGRDLSDMVEPRHPDLPPVPPRTRWLMGLASALLFLIPVVNLLAPIWSATMAVHVLHGRERKADG